MVGVVLAVLVARQARVALLADVLHVIVAVERANLFV